MLMSDNKLLESRFIAEQNFSPVIGSPMKVLFGKTLASSSSLWVSTLVFLQAYRILIQIPC